MHELSLVTHLIDLVEHQARQHGATQVLEIQLAVGEHSHLGEDTLQHLFELLTAERNSPARGATLRFRRVPMQFYCKHCEAKYSKQQGTRFTCPTCRQPGTIIEAGDEILLEQLEVTP